MLLNERHALLGAREHRAAAIKGQRSSGQYEDDSKTSDSKYGQDMMRDKVYADQEEDDRVGNKTDVFPERSDGTQPLLGKCAECCCGLHDVMFGFGVKCGLDRGGPLEK